MQIISMPRCSGKTMLVKIMRDMKRRERIQLIKWADELSDKDLEDAYYDAVYDCLGSETEKMYELGYDPIDIQNKKNVKSILAKKLICWKSYAKDEGLSYGNKE